jgi:hypothetical protein
VGPALNLGLRVFLHAEIGFMNESRGLQGMFGAPYANAGGQSGAGHRRAEALMLEMPLDRPRPSLPGVR